VILFRKITILSIFCEKNEPAKKKLSRLVLYHTEKIAYI
jgi:hypothetical protein